MKTRSSGMPMLEIIISIGLFTIISVFVLQLFLGANALSGKAKDISKAVIQAECIAEAIKDAESVEGALTLMEYTVGPTQEIGVAVEDGLNYNIYLDRNWKQVGEPSHYSIQIKARQVEKENGVLLEAVISVSKDKPYAFIRSDNTNQLCQIVTKSYR